jgi:hypothetical protein
MGKFRDTAHRENSLARARLRRSIGLPRPRRRLWVPQEIRCHCTLDISARSSSRMAFSRGLLVGGLIDHHQDAPKHRALSRGARPTESCERVANNAANDPHLRAASSFQIGVFRGRRMVSSRILARASQRRHWTSSQR